MEGECLIKAAIESKDLALMAAFSLVFFSLAGFNLGFLRAPVTGGRPLGEASVYLDLGSVQRVDSIYVLLGDSRPVRFDVYRGQLESWEYSASFHDKGYYSWRSIDMGGAESRYIKLLFYGQTGKMDEIYVVNEDNEKITVDRIWSEGEVDGDVASLVDEQELAELDSTYRSQTYFDEIYYVRAAEEYLNGEEPFEWTHPPLGKLIIALGVSVFGFSPFGWRILGVVFATLMVPTIYVLSKKMFHTRMAASISAFLLTFDFLHFTMGRIATVDTYAIFFTIASTLFFFLNYRGISEGEFNFNGLLVFLGIIFFSLAFSTKWYTIYGLIGQVFLILLFAIRAFLRSQHGLTDRLKEYALKPLSVLLLSFVLGGLVYASTFIPYMMLGHGLTDVYTRQFSMYNYHANLEATHPFSSAWWSWPLIARPLWLYVSHLPSGKISTITAMGNPVIWWVGLALMLSIFSRAIRRGDKTCLFILCLFLFQWLPYVFIRRCLFIYHFYTNVPMLILATTHFLNASWEDKWGRIFTIAYLSTTLIAFVLFYPVISGYPILEQGIPKWLKGWIL